MDSDSVSLLEGSRYLCGNLSPERPRETSHAHPIDAVSSCGSAVEKSGWLFENFSRVLLTEPLRCLTMPQAALSSPPPRAYAWASARPYARRRGATSWWR